MDEKEILDGMRPKPQHAKYHMLGYLAEKYGLTVEQVIGKIGIVDRPMKINDEKEIVAFFKAFAEGVEARKEHEFIRRYIDMKHEFFAWQNGDDGTSNEP
ncbi:MAG: hypothetical protein HC888_02560 [Candidatus Competibacteraceae bacterium]|nr:hypothetical protein [Candidatus Competibacteraceae bacterium]